MGIYAVIAVVGLGIGLGVGTWYEKQVKEPKRGRELTTYTPQGVILLDGETGKPHDITKESREPNHHMDKINAKLHEVFYSGEKRGN